MDAEQEVRIFNRKGRWQMGLDIGIQQLVPNPGEAPKTEEPANTKADTA